jgi:hypothetical protein
MNKHRHTDATFISEINEMIARSGHKPYSYRAVKPWRDGVAVPRPFIVAAIRALTEGQVTYQDYVDTVNERGIRTKAWPEGAA